MAEIQLDTLCYYKPEIDAMMDAETTRVNAELDAKLDKSRLGAPAGAASLTTLGKLKAIEIPFASVTEALDATNETTVMNPKRVAYILGQKSVAIDQVGVADGIAPLDANGQVPSAHLPPSRIYKTYVVATLAEMYALPLTNTIVAGDRAVVTNEPTDVGGDKNGEYVAQIDNPASFNWMHIPNLSVVSSVNGQVGIVNITTTTQGTNNSLRLDAVELDIVQINEELENNHSIVAQLGINVDTLITAGTYYVDTGLPYGLTHAVVEVMRDKRVVLDTGVQQRIIENASGIYATRTTIDNGVTWSDWTLVPSDIVSDYYDLVPQTSAPAASAGRIFFNDSTEAFTGYLNGGSIELGRQLYVRVHNATGTTITKGSAIRYGGSIVGGYPTVVKANASLYETAVCQGVTMGEIANGSTGLVATFGLIRGINLSGFAAGDMLYVSNTGTLTNVAGTVKSQVGIVFNNVTDGTLFVYPQPLGDFKASGFMQKNAAVLSLTTDEQTVVNYSLDKKENVSTNTTTGEIVVQYTGTYKLEVTVDGVSNVNNREVTLVVNKNSLPVYRYGFATNVGDNNRGSASFMYTMDCNAGDVIKLGIYADGAMAYSTSVLQMSINSTIVAV